jgi:hypothetical protein
MGGKAPIQAPPAIDQSVYDKTDAAEAKVSAEKSRMLSTNKKGQSGTILTSGQGVEEEATTSQTLLGGKKY